MTPTLTANTPVATADPRREGLMHHAVVFVLVLALLGFINFYTGGHIWAHWVLLGWGTGLAAHAFFVLRR